MAESTSRYESESEEYEKDELFNLSEEEEEDPLVGLSQPRRRIVYGEGLAATDQELEWLDLVEAVREHARNGDVGEALCADQELATVLFRSLPDARLLGGEESLVCPAFDEPEARSPLPEDSAVIGAVRWAAGLFRDDPSSTTCSSRQHHLDEAPRDIDKRALMLALQCRAECAAAYPDMDRRRQWVSVERSARARNDASKAKARAARVKPRLTSASIAIYNNTRHSHFSPVARASEATDDALRCCCLRQDEATQRRVPRQLLHMRSSNVSSSSSSSKSSFSLDLESDVAALVAVPDGALGVFRPTRDDCRRLHQSENSVLLGPVLAEGLDDGRAERAWVFTTNEDGVWLIEGFDVATGSGVARLEFPLAFKSKFLNWRPTITRCVDRVIAGVGENRLYVWSITDAAHDFAARCSHARKKPRVHRRADLATPARETVVSDDVYWSVGDCQRLTDSTVCLAPASDSRYSSLRVFDARHERTVRLLAGHREPSALARQHCAASHDLVFSIEPRTSAALVFDLRLAAPAFVLPCCGRVFHHNNNSNNTTAWASDAGSGILGVPCAGHACVALTWALDDECVRAFDLRRPVYHAYTLSTGNRSVTNLAWHASSASLLAATTSTRPASDQWPPDAVHHEDYFAERLDLSGPHRSILHYAFDDGRPLRDRRFSRRPPSWP